MNNSATKPKDKTLFSVKEAAAATENHRNTIGRHLRDGDLACTVDNRGKKWIDGAELHRVYGDKFNPDLVQGVEEGAKPVKTKNDPELDKLRQELDRERKSRIEFLEQSLATALETKNTTTLLLEDKSKAHTKDVERLKRVNSGRRKKLKKLREDHKMRLEELQTELQTEREKSWWHKLWE